MRLIGKKILINSAWILVADDMMDEPGKVMVRLYDRDFLPDSCVRLLPRMTTIESDDGNRTLIAVDFDGKRYEVMNKRHIFDYGLHSNEGDVPEEPAMTFEKMIDMAKDHFFASHGDETLHDLHVSFTVRARRPVITAYYTSHNHVLGRMESGKFELKPSGRVEWQIREK
jgi:hypothetical protein